MEPAYSAAKLADFSARLLRRAGLTAAAARDVAEVLTEGELLGKRTHGLALLPQYLQQLEKNGMKRAGRPKILRARAAALTLDANYLPGPHVVRRAIAWAVPRAKKFGGAAVAIRRCHHIACLQAYLPAVTQKGLVILLVCSDPANTTVAPPGGVQAVCSPNPLAAGFPTEGDPVLIDTTTSSATNAQVTRLHKQGKKFSSACLQTSQGEPTNDPSVLFTEPRGTILPLGGLDLGYKGFAFSILVEALTSGLGGYGRRDKPDRWGASVFLQIWDPKLFGGLKEFRQQTDYYVQSVRRSTKKPKSDSVRLPGELALAIRRKQLETGVQLSSEIAEPLHDWAQKLNVNFPPPLKPRAR